MVRTEYQVLDLDESDENGDGAICSLMDPETSDTVNDLRIPVRDPEYKPLVEAVKENTSGAGKDVFVVVLEAMGTRKVLTTFVTK